eukprot:scaffold148980_cov51-Attheya_sp.AAC.2
MVAGNEGDEDAAMEEQLRIFLGDDMKHPTGVPEESSSQTSIHPGIALFLGGAFCLNLGMLLSLPPVLRGRGAPYLPTFGGKLKIMFQQVRSHPTFGEKVNQGTPMRFVDLGSGDGRVVFRAAREKLFQTSIGYEINPGFMEGRFDPSGCRGGLWAVTHNEPTGGWRTSVPVEDGVHLYVTPHCWGGSSTKMNEP